MLVFVKTSLILFSARSCFGFFFVNSIPQILTGLCGTPDTEDLWQPLSMGKLGLPELRGWYQSILPQMQNPQGFRFWTAGALGVKESYCIMADCLEMHNSGYLIFFLLSFAFLYLYLFCTYVFDEIVLKQILL